MKNKLLLKYLLSYIMVLMVPILAFAAFIQQSLMEEMHGQFETESIQALEQFAAVADGNLSRLDTIRDHLLARNDLKLEKGLEDVPGALSLIKELKTYTVSNSIFSDLVFWINGDDYIYTSHGSYKLDDFFSGRFYYQDWTTKEFIQEAGNRREREIRSQEPVFINGQEHQAMTVIYPVMYQEMPVTLMFLIEEDRLFPMNPPSAYCIQDASGRILYANYQGKGGWPDLAAAPWKEAGKAGVETALYKGFMAIRQTSPATGLSYVRISPVEDVFGRLHLLQKRFYWVLGLLLCGGCFLIWMAMALNYRPLRQLWLFVQRLSRENQELKDSAYDASKGHFLYLMIKERVAGEEFLRQAKLLHMEDLLFPYVFVVIVAVKKEDVGKVGPQGVEEVVRSHLPGYLREDEDHGKYVFIGSTPCHDPLAFHHKVLDVLAALKAHLHIDVVVSKSSLSTGVEGIPRCYMDAMLAVDYRFIKGYNCVIDSAMVPVNGEVAGAYPRQLFEKLNYQVQNWDADRIQESLGQIIKYLKSAQLPLYYAKGLCYHLLNEISTVIRRLNQELSLPNRLSYATILADYDTVDELIQAVGNICLNICAFMRDEKAREETKRVSDIKDYIKKRALGSDFAIQNMAADFHMTLPALSVFFKEQCGITLRDYVAQYRMGQAVRLLVEEGCPVHEIVEQVGYLNPSSFIRKFKSIYGLTPGQYVQQYKGE